MPPLYIHPSLNAQFLKILLCIARQADCWPKAPWNSVFLSEGWSSNNIQSCYRVAASAFDGTLSYSLPSLFFIITLIKIMIKKNRAAVIIMGGRSTVDIVLHLTLCSQLPGFFKAFVTIILIGKWPNFETILHQDVTYFLYWLVGNDKVPFMGKISAEQHEGGLRSIARKQPLLHSNVMGLVLGSPRQMGVWQWYHSYLQLPYFTAAQKHNLSIKQQLTRAFAFNIWWV